MEYTYRRPWIPAPIEEAIFGPERVVIVEGATKTAKTTTAMLWLAEQAMTTGRPGRTYWWVSSVYATAEIAFQRLKRGLPPGLMHAREDRLTISLPNGADIVFRSAERPDVLFGADVYGAVGDEVSRWREAAWHALRTTLTATRAPVRLVHNVKGTKNWAFRLARQAEAGAPDMRHAVFTAYDAVDWGILRAEEVEDARRILPVDVFDELYLCRPSDDGGNPFGLAAIRAGLVPLSSRPPAVWGVDLARSVDWTAAIGLDDQGTVCAVERWQAPWPETEDRLARLIGAAPCLVDATGVGDPVLAHLQRLVPNAEGFVFSAPSKQQLMERLAVAIQRGEVRFPDGVIRAELEAFEYEVLRTSVRYSAPQGMHDDTVCALALAVRHGDEHAKRERNQYFKPEWFRKVSTDGQPATPEAVHPGPAPANRYVSGPPRPPTPRYPALTDEDADILRARFAADKPIR